MTGRHTVDYHDGRGTWACSCGYTAKRLAPIRRHASAANAADARERLELRGDRR